MISLLPNDQKGSCLNITHQGKKLEQTKLQNMATPPDAIPTQRDALLAS